MSRGERTVRIHFAVNQKGIVTDVVNGDKGQDVRHRKEQVYRDGRWTSEYAFPLDELGADPTRRRYIRFQIAQSWHNRPEQHLRMMVWDRTHRFPATENFGVLVFNRRPFGPGTIALEEIRRVDREEATADFSFDCAFSGFTPGTYRAELLVRRARPEVQTSSLTIPTDGTLRQTFTVKAGESRNSLYAFELALFNEADDATVFVTSFKNWTDRFVAGNKLNVFMVDLSANVAYKRRPEFNGRHQLYTLKDLERYGQFCRDNFVELMPAWQIGGHAGWWGQIKIHPDIREKGWKGTADLTHPDHDPIMFAVEPNPFAGPKLEPIPITDQLSHSLSAYLKEVKKDAYASATRAVEIPDGLQEIGLVPTALAGGRARDSLILREKDSSVTIPVGKRFSALVFLHTAFINDPRDKRARGAERRRWPYGWPVGDYVVTYADGTSEKLPLRLTMNIGRLDTTALSRATLENRYTYSLKDSNGDDVHFFQWEWPNPQPVKKIEQITVRHANELDVSLVLMAVSGRSLRAGALDVAAGSE